MKKEIRDKTDECVKKYWNPIIETMPLERLFALQLRKLKRILRWAYDNSPFYRRLYDDVGLEPGDIKTFEDFQHVPKAEKDMLREVQKREPFPYGSLPRYELKARRFKDLRVKGG